MLEVVVATRRRMKSMKNVMTYELDYPFSLMPIVLLHLSSIIFLEEVYA
jgi:hypothetical protein